MGVYVCVVGSFHCMYSMRLVELIICVCVCVSYLGNDVTALGEHASVYTNMPREQNVQL